MNDQDAENGEQLNILTDFETHSKLTGCVKHIPEFYHEAYNPRHVW